MANFHSSRTSSHKARLQNAVTNATRKHYKKVLTTIFLEIKKQSMNKIAHKHILATLSLVIVFMYMYTLT
jgi:hypothetical protein